MSEPPPRFRGLYVARLDIERPEHAGIRVKIDGQLEGFASLGWDFDLVCYRGDKVIFRGTDGGERILRRLPTRKSGSKKGYRFLYHLLGFHYDIWKQISSAYQACYVRHQMVTPSQLVWLYWQRTKTRVALEFPTFPYDREFRVGSSWWTHRLDLLLRRYLWRTVDLAVTYTPYVSVLGIPALQLGNGISPHSVKAVPLRTVSRDHILLTVVANLSDWHGIDRALLGLRAYVDRGLEGIRLRVVGEGTALSTLQGLARTLDLEHLVEFTGALSGKALEGALIDSDVGLGALACHRKGLMEDSSLKSRQYCSFGLPVVLASKDRDFPEILPFVFRVSPDDSPLDMCALKRWFFDYIQATSDHRRAIASWAKENLTWERQLAPVVQRLQHLAKGRGSC